MSAGREAEIPYITKKVAGVIGKEIWDFGGGERLEAYGIDTKKNNFVRADINSKDPGVKKINLVTGDGMSWDSVDIGICVSTIEHLGLDVYGQTPELYGDLKGLSAMLGTLKDGGILYVTAPVSAKGYMCKSWIRSYSCHELRLWEMMFSEYKFYCEVYAKYGEGWNLVGWSDLKPRPHYTDGEAITAVVCIEIRKR